MVPAQGTGSHPSCSSSSHWTPAARGCQEQWEDTPLQALAYCPSLVLPHTMASLQVHGRAACLKWELLAECGQGISLSYRSLEHRILSYWKNGVWDLSVQGQKSEGKEAPLGLWQRAGAMHPRTQESLPSFGTPKRRPTTAPPVSLLKHTERNCQQGQTWPSLGLIIWIQVCLLLCGRATEM